MTVDGPIVVLGGGGHAKAVIAALWAAGRTVSAVFDDDPARVGSTLLGVPVLGPIRAAGDDPSRWAVVAIGSNSIRHRLAGELSLRWLAVIHPRAFVADPTRVGPGSVVLPGAVVHVDAEVGAHAIVNVGAVVDHDCRVGDFAHVAPAACLCGGVRIGAGSTVGPGAVVVAGRRVGPGVQVAAGRVVGESIPGEGET